MPRRNEYKSILNMMNWGENGELMNVAEIKKIRDEAAAKILEILETVEKQTGMFVTDVYIENDTDMQGLREGVKAVRIALEIE